MGCVKLTYNQKQKSQLFISKSVYRAGNIAQRFISTDPLKDEYPYYTSYQYAGNKPINNIDVDGLEPNPETDTGGQGQPNIQSEEKKTKTNNESKQTQGNDSNNITGLIYEQIENGLSVNQLGLTKEETGLFLQDLLENIPQFGDPSVSSLSATITLGKVEGRKQQASYSTSGKIKLFTNVGKSQKLFGLTVAGFSEKIGVEFNNKGEVKDFATSEFDLLGLNLKHTINPITGGDSSTNLEIAIKFGVKDISITYRQSIENTPLPAHEKGIAGLMSAANTANRANVARVHLANQTNRPKIVESEIERSTPSFDQLQPSFKKFTKDFNPSDQFKSRKDATNRIKPRIPLIKP